MITTTSLTACALICALGLSLSACARNPPKPCYRPEPPPELMRPPPDLRPERLRLILNPST